MSKNEKYFLNSLRFAPCHAALSPSAQGFNDAYAETCSSFQISPLPSS